MTPVQVTMRFTGADLWREGDLFPDPVPVPRVPVEGERLRFPDAPADELWVVRRVTFNYENGLVAEPRVEVVYGRLR